MISASRQAVTRVAKPPTSTFLHYTYEAQPKGINVMTNPFTISEIHNNPCHPLYLRHKRRAKEFDPKLFHFTVRCSVKVSKHKTIRQWAARRVHNAFAQLLEENGLDIKGRPLGGTQDEGTRKILPLIGALLMTIPNTQSCITATKEEIRNNAAYVLARISKRSIYDAANITAHHNHARTHTRRDRTKARRNDGMRSQGQT